MKVKVSDIVEGIDFQSDESQSYLRRSTGEVARFSNDEIDSAESDEDLSEQPDWYVDAVRRAKEFLENENDFIDLPSRYEFHEYRVMEKFILSLPVEEQREELLGQIKGKGAFSRFRTGLDRFMLLERWYQYRDSELRAFVVQWCEENDLEIDSEK